MLYKLYAEKTAKKCNSRDPFVAAKSLGIMVITENLGALRGYYNMVRRQKFIHLHEKLDDDERRLVCAHELGHAVLHPHSNTPFSRRSTYVNVSRDEFEANAFAAFFLVSDSAMEEYKHLTVSQLANVFRVPQSWMEIRVR